jgi:hypothetical protein
MKKILLSLFAPIWGAIFVMRGDKMGVDVEIDALIAAIERLLKATKLEEKIRNNLTAEQQVLLTQQIQAIALSDLATADEVEVYTSERIAVLKRFLS